VWWRVRTGGSPNLLDGLHLGPDAMLWLPMVVLVRLDGGVTARCPPAPAGRQRAAGPAPELRHPALGERLAGRLVDWVNGWLPATSQLAKRPPRYNTILVIAATNRADALDPALLRPGRFDLRLHFDLPNAVGRRELIDYFPATKAHHPELDTEATRAERAHLTFGYTPLEREMVATHEAGHAVAAYLSGVGRRLEVLSIVKRKDALGLLAHNDTEERWTRTAPSCSPSCGSPAPAWPPRSCGSANRPPGRAATWSGPPASPPRWWGRGA
jgi:hypothetical protein